VPRSGIGPNIVARIRENGKGVVNTRETSILSRDVGTTESILEIDDISRGIVVTTRNDKQLWNYGRTSIRDTSETTMETYKSLDIILTSEGIFLKELVTALKC